MNIRTTLSGRKEVRVRHVFIPVEGPQLLGREKIRDRMGLYCLYLLFFRVNYSFDPLFLRITILENLVFYMYLQSSLNQLFGVGGKKLIALPVCLYNEFSSWMANFESFGCSIDSKSIFDYKLNKFLLFLNNLKLYLRCYYCMIFL